MDSTGKIDLITAFKKLLAENKSQEARLDEYEKILSSRDNEIEMLQAMLSEANAYRSSLDNQLKELADLQLYINDLQHTVAGSMNMPTAGTQRTRDTVSTDERLKNVTREHASLKVQLTEFQDRLIDMNNRNLLLQQENARIAELESLLQNAEAAINNHKR